MEEWLPPEVQSVLNNSQLFILYSLSPHETPLDLEAEDFHGFWVQGQVHVTDEDIMVQVVDSLRQSMTDPLAIQAMCFIPHHGLRAVQDSTFVDLVICYQCGNVQVFLGDAQINGWWSTSDTSEALLNSLLG